MGCSDCQDKLDQALNDWATERDDYKAENTDLRMRVRAHARGLESLGSVLRGMLAELEREALSENATAVAKKVDDGVEQPKAQHGITEPVIPDGSAVERPVAGQPKRPAVRGRKNP